MTGRFGHGETTITVSSATEPTREGKTMLNDTKRKAHLLGISGQRHFETYRNLTAENLASLIDEGLINPEARLHNSPTVFEFLEFMEMYPSVTAYGYATFPPNPNPRIVIEGLIYEGPIEPELIRDFNSFCATADHVNNIGLRSWWRSI
jgi:hypothetical protein